MDPGTVSLRRLDRFEIDPENGFLPAVDPPRSLPHAFAAWDEVAADLPRLLLAGRVRRAIERLPPIDADGLATPAEYRRAMVVLSYLGHAYVWGEESPATHIPSPLAVPWCEVAKRLGRPPVLSYASYALDNWRRYDAAKPIALGNIALLQNFQGGADEDWFVTVHIDIEHAAAPVLRAVGPIIEAVTAGDSDGVQSGLESIATAMRAIIAVLRRMPEHCDPYIYFRRVRPYIHGWQNHPLLADGVVYDGVAAYGGRGQKFRGETGAQSGIVPALDALLGIAHRNDPLRAYLLEMRDYMPPAHRAFIEAVEAQSRLRAFVGGLARQHPVCEIYDECVRALGTFRDIHLQYAARYIFRQAQSDPANPTGVGTGGTPFMPYLRKHRDETRAARRDDGGAPEGGAAVRTDDVPFLP